MVDEKLDRWSKSDRRSSLEKPAEVLPVASSGLEVYVLERELREQRIVLADRALELAFQVLGAWIV